MNGIDEKDQSIQRLLEENKKLFEEIANLKQHIAILEKRLGLNSNNSSKPPSGDGFNRPPRSSNLHSKGKNKSGGQNGHQGHTLIQVSNPDKIIRDKLTKCPHCLAALTSDLVGIIKRQVFDLPAQKIEVTEYQSEVKFCNDLANKLSGFKDVVLDKIKQEPIKHLGETGFRIGVKTNWLHVASNNELTYYHASPKRKSLLDGVEGIVVHDHWKPYYQMPNVDHALCNAHHLRELQALIDYDKEQWARKMKRLLRFMCKYKHHENISKEKLNRLEILYDKIVEEGLAYHDIKKRHLVMASIQTRKRYPGHNLLLRFKKYRSDVLRFLHNPLVPFTNNQAESDIRMMKLRQKISGGFRTTKGAEVFISIRTFISTARKQGWNVFGAISNAVDGNVPLAFE